MGFYVPAELHCGYKNIEKKRHFQQIDLDLPAPLPTHLPLKPLKTLAFPHELTSLSDTLKREGKSLGFVPTMGALHEGHLSLVREAKSKNDVVVASIFVNPTQFNDPKDFERYPRVVEEDQRMLESAGCDVLFLPSVKDMYPDDASQQAVSFGFLETVLEGAHRPGHFSGVGMVVKRLFEIVKPSIAYFGSKDYQQVMVIRSLVQQFSIPVEIIAMPTIRESDGLAMSSRNRLLSAEERTIALALSKALFTAKENYPSQSIPELLQHAIATLSRPDIRLEYFVICDGDTLREITDKSQTKNPVALVAAHVGKVRLIDNLGLGRAVNSEQ